MCGVPRIVVFALYIGVGDAQDLLPETIEQRQARLYLEHQLVVRDDVVAVVGAAVVETAIATGKRRYPLGAR